MLEIARSENQKLGENYVEPRDVRQSQQTIIFDFSHARPGDSFDLARYR